METKRNNASPIQEVRWETGWRERSWNKAVQDQEVIDQNSLKGSMRSNPRNIMSSNQKTLFKVESFSEPSGDPFQNIPETTQTSSRESRSERRDGKW